MNIPENKSEVIELFKKGPAILEEALIGLTDNELDYSPKKGGWTIREIAHHIADGDDIWKYCIRMAMGNEEVEFNLKWYWIHEQIEWAKFWGYKKRSIDVSLALLKANRNHIIQLLENVNESWTKTVKFVKYDGQIETVPVGAAIQIQADHVVHHVKRIMEIRNEILGE